MSVYSFSWRMLLMAIASALSVAIRGMKAEELPEDGKSLAPLPVFPPVSYKVLGSEYLLLQEASQEPTGNASLQTQRQAFLLTGAAGWPAINVSYGRVSVEQDVPLDLLYAGPRIRPFILARQVRSSAPAMRVLFYAASRRGGESEEAGRATRGPGEGGYVCVTVYAFWEMREVRGACSIPAGGGFCLAQLKPDPAWFSPGSRRASREQRSEAQGGNVAEVYFQSRPSRTSLCVPQDSKHQRGPERAGSHMQRIGGISLVRSPPGNPTFMRLRLGGAVVIQTTSKPLRTTDKATFYVFLFSASPVERFILRATVKKGMSFSTARPSDSHMWDIALEPGRGSNPQTLSIVCQKKDAFPGKRGLLEVLQLDFEMEELSGQSESQMITWHLEQPGNVKDEGVMRIYSTPKDYVGMAPLVMDTELLNTAVLTGKKVSVPLTMLAVEADGTVTDITNSTSCQSTDEEVLKVSKRCDSVFVTGEETRGKVRMTVNFTYSYLSAQLEVSVWMPRLPLHIEVSDTELSQIKGWRVPVAAGNRRTNRDSEEEEERKGKGCVLQYQRAVVQVLTPFTAETPAPERDLDGGPLAYFLGPDWQVDVTRLLRSSLRVKDPAVAQLQAGTVLAGRAEGVTTVQVMSPLSDSVLAERMVRVLDDKVSITELGVQLVSGLSLSLQLSPGSNRAIIATATTEEVLQSPKQEAEVGCWVQFSDGSLTPLDLYEPGSYALALASLDESVVSVRRSLPAVVAEGEGQGLLVRAALTICEACQKSKRKSRLVVGSGAVMVRFPPEQQPPASSGRSQGGDYGSDVEVLDPRLTLTSPQGLAEVLGNTTAGLQESTVREVTTATSNIPQEATGGSAVSTIQAFSSSTGRAASSGRPADDRAPATAGRGSVVGKDFGDLVDSSVSPSQVEEPTREPPSVESNLVRTLGSLTDVEIGTYSLVGVSCLAFLAFLLNCASYRVRVRGNKSPVQGQGPPEHTHNWVWLATTAEQGRSAPIPTTACSRESHRPTEARRAPEALPARAGEERTATLGRRSSAPPPRSDSAAGRSATLLARPARSEPLHSPTSKRNQVKFTTFTTLDIKHLAALKKNGLAFNWTSQDGGCSQPGGFARPTGHLPELPWPVATPVGQV